MNRIVPTKTQSFIKGAMILTVAGILIKIIGAVNKIYISRMLGGEGIGLYQMAALLYATMTSLATAGIPTAISILVAERLALRDGPGVLRIRNISFWLLFGFGFICSFGLYFSAELLTESHAIYDERAVLGIQAVAPALLVVTMVSSFRGYFQGFQDMVPTATSQIFEQITRVLTMFGLAYVLLPYGLTYAAAGAAFSAVPSTLVALLILLFFFYRQRGVRATLRMTDEAGHNSWKHTSAGTLVKSLLLLAIPVSLANVMMPMMNMVDLFIAPKRLVEALGYSVEDATAAFGYLTGMASSLINLPIIFTTSLAASLVPAISEAHALNHRESVMHRTEQAFKMTLLFTLPAAVGMMVLAEPISSMLYATKNAGGSIFVLSLSIILLGLQQVSTGVLQGLGYASLPMWNLLIGMIFKVAVTWFLLGVEAIAIEGAAWGTNAAFGLAAALNIVYISKYTSYRFSIRDLGQMGLAVAVMGVSAYGTHMVLSPIVGNELAVMGAILVALVVYSVAVFGLRIMVWNELLAMPVVGKLIKKVRK